jgi:hypothetical protein
VKATIVCCDKGHRWEMRWEDVRPAECAEMQQFHDRWQTWFNERTAEAETNLLDNAYLIHDPRWITSINITN